MFFRYKMKLVKSPDNTSDDLLLQNELEDWSARQLGTWGIIKLRIQELNGYSYEKKLPHFEKLSGKNYL